LSYFSHLFGHEGENSLMSYLKKEDLAMTVYSMEGNYMKGVESLLEVEVVLTTKGLENYE
jgi:insulysin